MSTLLRSLQAEYKDLSAEGQALSAQAAKADGYTDDQKVRRDEIVARLTMLESDIEAENVLEHSISVEPGLVAEDDRPGGAAIAGAPDPFTSLGDQLQAVVRTAKTGRVENGLLEVNAHALNREAATGAGESVGFDGGFAVQEEFIPGILDRVYEGSMVAQYCDTREIGPNANGVKYNVVDETSRVDGSRGGGVLGYWIGEGDSLTATRPKLAQKSLELGKVACLFYATDELLEDAVALESFTNAEMQDEMAFQLDDKIIEGTGAGVPTGVLNADALVTVAKESGQAADTVNLDNVRKMYQRMPARSRTTAAWYINDEVWPEIWGLEQVVGTGGVPVYLPPNGAQGAPEGMLLGRPIRPIEQASALGDAGDIMFNDMSRYMLIRKGGVRRAVSIHVQFLTDETAFRWILRVNGRPKPLAAVTPFKGTLTKSPFVTLAARA